MKRQSIPRISLKSFEKYTSIGVFFLLLLFGVTLFEVYMPINPNSQETITYAVQKGTSASQIGGELSKLGVIRSNFFFQFYLAMSLQYNRLQAGDYSLSPRMSSYQIARRIAQGNVIKNTVVILEGWDLKDIGDYLEEKGICTHEEFYLLASSDYSSQFNFLNDKPKNATLEGYLFPDTYQVAKNPDCSEIIFDMLNNFDKKVTQDMRDKIKGDGKSIFDIVTMASIIEKEVRKEDDKKMVSSILWKRISIGMPLQVDASINYITGKSDASALIKDTKIDSPYNTYKYNGLPVGPISNPGLSSILAAMNPVKTDYLYYLSDGITHYSKTLEEHNEAKVKYLD